MIFANNVSRNLVCKLLADNLSRFVIIVSRKLSCLCASRYSYNSELLHYPETTVTANRRSQGTAAVELSRDPVAIRLTVSFKLKT